MEFGDSLRVAEDREMWKAVIATSYVVPRQPARLRDRLKSNRSTALYLRNCHAHSIYLLFLLQSAKTDFTKK